jgi:hypothetical protein
MSEGHTNFVKRLTGSTQGVFKVAEWLHKKGKTIEIPMLNVMPQNSDPMDYVDDGDIFIIKRERIEVKHRNVNFTGPHDFPYPTMLVSNKAAVDRANNEVVAYINLSKDMQNMAIIPRETRDSWLIEKKLAGNTGNVETYYSAPINVIIFRSLMGD